MKRYILPLLLIAVLSGCRQRTPEITWSLMHPTQLDSVYMKRIIDESRNHPVDNFEICGGCNSGCEGSLDGLLLFEEWPLAEAAQNRDVVLSNRDNLKAIIRMSHEEGKEVYYWHREVLCNDGLVASIPGLLDESGEFNLFGKAYEELLRYKIRKTFEIVPDLDGLVLTLTEASFSSLHNSRPEIYPPVKVVEKIGGIFAQELKARGKRFILRSFGSIPEDYENILSGAELLAKDYNFEIETKITPYDFDPFLPDNQFLKKIPGCTLGAECDVLGEFLGCGRMLPEHVDEICRYVKYARTKKVDRYTIRLDRKWKSVFDVYPINLYAYEQAILHPEKTADEIRREYYDARYPQDISDKLFEMSKDGMECVKKAEFIDGNIIFHWYPTTADLRLMKAGGILDLFAPEGADLGRACRQWAILSDKPAPGRARIIEEKKEAAAIANANLKDLSGIVDHLAPEDVKRLEEGWQVSKAESESLVELVKVISAYFDGMEARDGDARELKAAMDEMDKALEGRTLLRPIPELCKCFIDEYPLELELRRRLDTTAVDYVLPGCIGDQYKVEHYMHAAFCKVAGDAPLTVVGNSVFPDGYIAMGLKGCGAPARICISGFGTCLVEINGVKSEISIDRGGEIDVPAADSYEIRITKAPGKDYPGIISVACLASAGRHGASQESIYAVSDKVASLSAVQCLMLGQDLPSDRMPKTFENGNVVLTGGIKGWWVTGFFPGTCWYSFLLTGNDDVKALALAQTEKLSAPDSYYTNHDLGFQVMCSLGMAFKATGDNKYLPAIKRAAELLASRYSPVTGTIMSWNEGQFNYPVIIDNMMNLELLTFAAKQFNVPQWRKIAINHAETTMKNHFRDNFSCYHMVDYDKSDGTVVAKRTVQGFADESAWSRGQAWALYGYTMMFRETGKKEFLTQAEHIAGYLLPRLAANPVPV